MLKTVLENPLILYPLVLLLLIYTLIIHPLLTSRLTHLPGPLLSRFTSLPLLYHEFKGNRRPYIHSLHQRYGPVVRIAPREVSFVGEAGVRGVYADGLGDREKGTGAVEKTEFYTLFEQFGKRTMFSTLGKAEHTQRKRYIAAPYANSHIMRPQVLDDIRERAMAFVGVCLEAGEASVDVYALLHCYAMDCASNHFFHPHGTRSIEQEEHRRLMEEMTYHESLTSNLLQYHFPMLAGLQARFMPARPSELSNNFIKSVCRPPLSSSSSEHTLVHKLQASGTYASKPLDIAAEIMDHFVAGLDTTGVALSFLMYHISLPANAHVQDKLFREFQQYGNDRGLDEMKYLEAVIKEGLRCFPPIPMSLPRYVPQGGRTIDGFFIPERTIVSCQAYSVHLLNEDVYPNAEVFDPERWLGEKSSLEMERLFFAFGAGSRGCIGRHLAMAEMRCLLKEVYSRFRTHVADDMKGSMEISDQIISSRPKDQVCKLRFELRG